VLDGSCVVLSGTLRDPYTRDPKRFAPNDPTATGIDIDHVESVAATRFVA